MRLSPVRLAMLLVLLASLLVGSPAVARGSARSMQRDHTDNGFSFSYDGNEGEIDTATSSVRVTRNDPVTFLIYIRDNPSSETVGSRLRARLTLGLRKQRAIRYEGRFWFEIQDRMGTVVYTDAVNREVLLRSRKGESNSSMTFDFDLPSGDYSAQAFFEAEA